MKNRIAFISEHASPLAALGGVDSGGQNVYVAELARQLSYIGYQIDIFTRRDDKILPDLVQWEPGIRVIHVYAGPAEIIPKEQLFDYMPEFTGNMLKFITDQNIRYELIHANFWMSGIVACELKAILNIPFVITFHALGHVRRIHQKEADKFPESRMFFEEEAVKKADRVIAECPQDLEDLVQLYHADPAKVNVIPCGFSDKEFYPVNKTQARKIAGLPANDRILLQLGRMVPRKGVDNVIKALGELKRKSVEAKLVIVGGETGSSNPELCPELVRLMDIAREHDVADLVIFAGRKNRDMLKYYYSAADIFITTPWYEPFGITPLEAMACGTPVIGADVGGIKYSVADNLTGFLVPANDPKALAEKAAVLLTNQELLQTMKKNAIERVNNEFTWSKVGKMIDHVYKEIQTSVRQTVNIKENADLSNLLRSA
ncbi:glycosyltransferase [Pedobacter sp. HMF7647]|uniref:Glycosyltransferase n=1 Tax=Hufsiella arboris TaxID=2695275 RepID=A0A7K1YED8_9SPHI|nr:glycosyltransferase family 1 protein [Hufsiella arboris]MXV52399.1 glycosyltransferase [Hufsiella arboris]